MSLSLFARSFSKRADFVLLPGRSASRSQARNITQALTWRARPKITRTSWLIALCAMFGASSPVYSQSANELDAPIVTRGDAVVSSFSGAKRDKKLPKDVHPLDVTYIDPQSSSLRVFDLSKLGGPPQGQNSETTKKLSVTAKEIGQVFGIVLDSPDDGVAPNIFAAATSLYGLQIVGKRDGKLTRLVRGEPGARWMSGQFATRNGGGPGTIWKIDGVTGTASLFSKIKSGPNDNAGPGLGALAYDFVTRQIYVPNLETGFIHHVDETGKDLGFYDHGTLGRLNGELEAVSYDASKRMSIEDPAFNVEKPDTWGMADKRRLVIGVAIQNNRLYYSVEAGPQIWSVGLDSAGGFVDDARMEIDLSEATEAGMITAIAFDGPGKIYLTQRGEIAGSYDYRTFARPNKAAVIQYSWIDEDKNWSLDAQEFAVGVNAPHRSTNGGIALGYGYDEKGKINTSSCNATLWTTGDHLSDEAAGDVVSGLQGIATSLGQTREQWHPTSSSSALKSGLSSTEVTELDPPSSIWFIDLDGQSKDTDAFGHVGSLVIHSPSCDPAVSEPSIRPEPIDLEIVDPLIGWPDLGPDDLDPDDFPPWGVPPIGMPGLDITKSCAPAAFGGVFQCTITVTNSGTLHFFAPIKVTDATTIASGPGAGGVQKIAAVTPDGPEWTCTPAPTMNLTCGLPAGALPPGKSRSFVVDIDTSDMIADGNVGFTNCASLGAPYWGIACDHAGSDITVKKTADPGCVAGNDCTYNLEISNKSGSPFNGQVQLSDEMYLGIGAALNAPITAINGNLGCNGGDPVAIPFSCQATMTLAAFETRSISITATMPAAPPNYWARNCFALTAAGLAPGDLKNTMPPGGGTLGSGGAVSCAWMQVGVPGPHSNLKMDKSAQACGKLPGDPNTVKCDYTISITNTGPSDFNSPVIFDETIDPAATLIFNDPKWGCIGGPPTATCTSVGNAVIAANETITIPVSVTTPKNVVEANTCFVPNTVTLTTPPVNIATNYLGGDDTAQADGDAFLLEFIVNGAAIILCDPTNLKTTKVSKGPCEKAGSDWRCKFGIEVENTGPDPYKGRIELLDIMSIAPSSVSFSGTAGWSRTPAVGHDVYRLPLRTLQKGDSVKLDVTLVIPDGNYCSISNTAHMTFPVLKRHNGDKTDDTSQVSAKIPRPECRKPPVCKPKAGEIRTSSGACACEDGATRGTDGQCKVPPKEPEDPKPEEPDEPTDPETPTARCPDGYPIPRNGICPCDKGMIWDTGVNKCIGDDYDPPNDTVDDDPVVPVPLCRLLPGQIRTSLNKCVCPNGRAWNSKTYCKPKPCTLLPGQIRTSKNKCVCENGRKWNSKTYCSRRTPSCKPRAGEVIIRGKCLCANGRTWNAKTYCEPPAENVCPSSGTYQAAPGVCCLIGQVYRDGKCRKPPQSCNKPRFENNYGTCTCGPNKVFNARKNTCKPKDPTGPTIGCSGGTPVYMSSAGLWRCSCPKGKKPVKAAKNHYRCVADNNPAKDCKAKGWKWTGKYCVKPVDPAQQCRDKGWTWTGKRCVKPLSPAQKCKAKGWKWTGRSCVKPLSPAQKCKIKGWKWTGKSCIKPLSPAQRCKSKGWKWTGKSCIKPLSPAQKCKSKGWKWTGKSCIKPLSPAQKCKSKGWRWTGKSCIKPLSPAQKCKIKGWKWTGKRCIKPVKPCPKGTKGPGWPNCKKIIILKQTPSKIYLPKKTYKTKKINMRQIQRRRRVN